MKGTIYIASIFNEKIREGIKGRVNLFTNLNKLLQNIDKDKKTFWFHSSSMGEFEQAKPIIEKLKSTENINIVATFFSPSGYNHSLKYPYADVISYLPFDTVKNAEKFIQLVQPDKMIFMQYDYWPNIVWVLKKNNVPTFIVDAKMAEDSKRKLFLVKQFHIWLFKHFTKILTISENDKNSFMDFDIDESNLLTVGDTRFDRVYQKSLEARIKNLINNKVLKDKKVIILGSPWEEDFEVLLPALKKILNNYDKLLIIIAPHEPTKSRLVELESNFPNKTIRFSNIYNYQNQNIILIDSIGILLSLYHYAHIAFIGGSFKQKIHNVLEPAVYGIPVLFGPKNKNSQEALAMINKGCGLEINNTEETYKIFKQLLDDENERKRIGKISTEFIKQNVGVTEKVLKIIL